MALLVLCGVSVYVYKTNNVSETYENKETKKVNDNMLSMMLETSAGSGEYQKTSASAWPTEGYVFNETLSKCEQGSILSWDSTKNNVVMKGNISDKCYVYFDVYVPPSIEDYCNNGDNLASCIKIFGNQGSEISNIYIHNTSLTNGAGDNSYRYAGSSDTTNNFVCFGYNSTDGTCPTDYLYRIIGVFDNQVKLIKYDYANSNLLGTDGNFNSYYSAIFSDSIETYKGYNTLLAIGVYYWNYSSGRSSKNTWSESELNTINLNTNYLNNIETSWSNKIATHTWKVGGNTYSNIYYETAPNAYINEITSPAEETTYDAKVGLMYVSDYGYAAAPSAWNTTLDNYYSSSVRSVNWMYMGLYEWTIARSSGSSDNIFRVSISGMVDSNCVYYYYALRPVFYLTSETAYKSGSGTISSPILLK